MRRGLLGALGVISMLANMPEAEGTEEVPTGPPAKQLTEEQARRINSRLQRRLANRNGRPPLSPRQLSELSRKNSRRRR